MAIPTMLISGNKYAKVTDRVKAFLEKYEHGFIETDYEIRDGFVIFHAKVFTKQNHNGQPQANGHSLCKLTGGKTFEKAETVSVGRALAFLGIMSDGSIASADEMEDLNWDIHDTDQYKDAIYQMEDLLETCNIVDETVEQVRRDYGSYELPQLYKALKWLRALVDEGRIGNGNMSAKEINKKVADKLEDPNA